MSSGKHRLDVVFCVCLLFIFFGGRGEVADLYIVYTYTNINCLDVILRKSF